MAEFGRVNLTVEHCEPARKVGKPFEVRTQEQPVLLGRRSGEAAGDGCKVELVKQPGVDQLNLMRIEMGRRTAERREIEALGELVQARGRLDRLRGADPRQHRQHRHRLDALRADVLGAIGAEPLGQFALGGDQQRLVREVRRPRAQRLEHLDLRRAVRDMVLAADDVGDAELDIVDDARQQVEPAAVLAAHDGVAEQPGIEALLAADEVIPDDRRIMVEPEAPMRRAAFGHRSFGRLAFIDGRQAAPEQHLAAQLELVRRFVAGIDAAGVLQPLEFPFVEFEALGLADDSIGIEAHPCKIVPDCVIEFSRRAFAVGVVDPQQERPAVLSGEQEIVQRSADIPDVETPGRRRREARDDAHSGNSRTDSRSAAWMSLASRVASCSALRFAKSRYAAS